MILKVVHALDPIHGHLSEIEHTCCQLFKGINNNDLSPLDWNPYSRIAMTLKLISLEIHYDIITHMWRDEAFQSCG